MVAWVLLAGGLAIFVLAVRLANRRARGLTQGFGVLAAALGAIMLLRRSRSGLHLPGYGPREWRQP